MSFMTSLYASTAHTEHEARIHDEDHRSALRGLRVFVIFVLKSCSRSLNLRRDELAGFARAERAADVRGAPGRSRTAFSTAASIARRLLRPGRASRASAPPTRSRRSGSRRSSRRTCGAEPCTGSNIDVRPGMNVARRRHARGRPATRAPRSVMMSPNRLLVTMTSNCAGVEHHVHRERVDVVVRRLDRRDTAARPRLNTRCQSAWPCCIALLLSAMQTFVSPCALRELEGVPDDPVHALVGVDLFLNRDLVVGARP